MNTRTYPRSSIEAFPNTVQYAAALERPAPNPYPRVLWVALIAGFFAAILSAWS
jgi:hypothetical protein